MEKKEMDSSWALEWLLRYKEVFNANGLNRFFELPINTIGRFYAQGIFPQKRIGELEQKIREFNSLELDIVFEYFKQLNEILKLLKKEKTKEKPELANIYIIEGRQQQIEEDIKILKRIVYRINPKLIELLIKQEIQ